MNKESRVRLVVRRCWFCVLPVVLVASFVGVGTSFQACRSTAPASPEIRPGVDVLLTDSAHLVANRRVGLLTNQTGVNSHRVSDVELLIDAGINLTALFSPEHGFRGRLDQPNIDHSTDSATGLPIYSLYGDIRAPTEEMLGRIDVMLVDLQDIGARTYTYIAAILRTMQAAAPAEMPVVVLDRPNPIGGLMVQGPMMDLDYSSNVGVLPVPLRHGMTMAELALFGNEKLDIGAALSVVPVAGWRRDLWFDDTGLPWIPPSLNMPSLESAAHYPGIVLFEGTNLSVGRGTPIAFQVVGAPWLDAREIATRLGSEEGVAVIDTVFTPRSPSDGKNGDESLPGLRFRVTDRATYDPLGLAVRLLAEIKERHGDSLVIRSSSYFDARAGSDALRILLEIGGDTEGFLSSWEPSLAAFMRTREPYLIYR